MHNIAIFASGNGTNGENIIRYFKKSDTIRVAMLLSNNPAAPAIAKAAALGVPVHVFSDIETVMPLLFSADIELVVLAGYLRLVPKTITDKIRTINIHPALLPKFSGRGMYGIHVHEAVIAAGEKESGITIHDVTPIYDEGNIIFQTSIPISDEETPESLAERIHELEYYHYPRIIEQILSK